ATGYKRMIEQLKELQPTVVFLCYGGNEAFAGEEGLPRFQAKLAQLLTEIDALKARVVFLSPNRHENLGPPLPDPAAFSTNLGYGSNEAFAEEEGLPRFQAQLDQLLAEIDALKARVVFLSPIRHENLGPPPPDPAVINTNLAYYVNQLQETAARRDEPFVDLY